MLNILSVKEYESYPISKREYINYFIYENLNISNINDISPDYLFMRDKYVISLCREIYHILSQNQNVDNTIFNPNQFRKEVYREYLSLLDLLSEIIMHDPCIKRKEIAKDLENKVTAHRLVIYRSIEYPFKKVKVKSPRKNLLKEKHVPFIDGSFLAFF